MDLVKVCDQVIQQILSMTLCFDFFVFGFTLRWGETLPTMSKLLHEISEMKE
jgi:hypothetical protein